MYIYVKIHHIWGYRYTYSIPTTAYACMYLYVYIRTLYIYICLLYIYVCMYIYMLYIYNKYIHYLYIYIHYIYIYMYIHKRPLVVCRSDRGALSVLFGLGAPFTGEATSPQGPLCCRCSGGEGGVGGCCGLHGFPLRGAPTFHVAVSSRGHGQDV